jgi:hypothetical protein
VKDKNYFLLTDTLPYEVPIIFSNYLLYEFIKSSSKWSKIKISYNSLKQNSEPYSFFINKTNEALRLISLVHPLAQLQMLKFIEHFDQELINYMNLNNIFSIRFPYDINTSPHDVSDQVEKQLKFIMNSDSYPMKFNDNEYIQNANDTNISAVSGSYFKIKKYLRITDFYYSSVLKYYETKYSHLIKIDIQSCFYNIYTHSLDWAYLGDKKLAKSYARSNDRFSSLLDKLMQCSNYGETNGIVVGPEFSRCVVEIILMKIDKTVYLRLIDQSIVYKKDYEIVRFMDDIFIFCNDKKTGDKIKKQYAEICSEYKLSINESKTYIEERPFIRKNIWVAELKRILARYINSIEPTFYKDNKFIDDFIYEIKCLLISYESQSDNIVSFVMSFFENRLEEIINEIDPFEEFKVNAISGLIDLLHYIISFSITSNNVVKYCKILTAVFVQCKKNNSNEILNKLFQNGYELLKYHQSRNIELLNLIIIMKDYAIDLPESILLDFINIDKGYFTLSTMAFYISDIRRKNKYKKTRVLINEVVETIVRNLYDFYIADDGDKEMQIRNMICSKEFYIIHDFYSSTIIKKDIKIEILRIKDLVNTIYKDNSSIFNIFIEYIKDFDKPFMNWQTTSNEIITSIVHKSVKSKVDSRISG